jgi:hypothetical protein
MLGVVVCSVLLIGLVLDGGVVLRARSDAFGLAGAAARVGAQQLDPSSAVEGDAVIDPTGAREAATAYLAARNASGTITVSGNSVTVTVTVPAHLQMLQVLGASTVAVHATATARAIKAGA